MERSTSSAEVSLDLAFRFSRSLGAVACTREPIVLGSIRPTRDSGAPVGSSFLTTERSVCPQGQFDTFDKRAKLTLIHYEGAHRPVVELGKIPTAFFGHGGGF